MKFYIKSQEYIDSPYYSNSITYKEADKYNPKGSPIYWDSVRGRRIVSLLESFSEKLDSNPSILSWEIEARDDNANIKLQTVDGELYPYWSFSYSSLKSDNDKNLAWLMKGLDRFI